MSLPSIDHSCPCGGDSECACADPESQEECACGHRVLLHGDRGCTCSEESDREITGRYFQKCACPADGALAARMAKLGSEQIDALGKAMLTRGLRFDPPSGGLSRDQEDALNAVLVSAAG